MAEDLARAARGSDAGTWVIVAAYNEDAMVAAALMSLIRKYEVVVVDDGSTDSTAQSARDAGARVIRHVINRGQGAALQTGVEFALARGARRIVTFDADGQHRPEDVDALLGALDAGADIALGSRFLGGIRGAPRNRERLLRLAVRVSNLLAGLKLTDAHCGLRAFRADVAPKLRITQDRMAHASELLLNVRRHGLRWIEVPVTVHYTPYSLKKGQRSTDAARVLLEWLAGLVRLK